MKFTVQGRILLSSSFPWTILPPPSLSSNISS
jgi:hypothetical protein